MEGVTSRRLDSSRQPLFGETIADQPDLERAWMLDTRPERPRFWMRVLTVPDNGWWVFGWLFGAAGGIGCVDWVDGARRRVGQLVSGG